MANLNLDSNAELPASKSTQRQQRIFKDNVKWSDMQGIHPDAIPGRSPFLYGPNVDEHALRIESLDVDFSGHKPEGIKFDESELDGFPQRPFYQSIRLSGSLDRSLEHWPFFSIEQSLAEGEPPGYPGFTPLKPWEDDKWGWIRIMQNGHQLTENVLPVAGPLEMQCCFVGMLDDASQGGFKGKYAFKFDAYLDADAESTPLTSMKAEIWIKSPNDEWPKDSF